MRSSPAGGRSDHHCQFVCCYAQVIGPTTEDLFIILLVSIFRGGWSDHLSLLQFVGALLASTSHTSFSILLPTGMPQIRVTPYDIHNPNPDVRTQQLKNWRSAKDEWVKKNGEQRCRLFQTSGVPTVSISLLEASP